MIKKFYGIFGANSIFNFYACIRSSSQIMHVMQVMDYPIITFKVSDESHYYLKRSPYFFEIICFDTLPPNISDRFSFLAQNDLFQMSIR